MSDDVYQYLAGQYPSDTSRERIEFLYNMWENLE